MKLLRSITFSVAMLALLAGCTNEGEHRDPVPSKSMTPATGASAAPGRLAVVAEAGRPGDPDLDRRSRLSEIKELLPAPDGGLLVVSHKDDRIFTEITPGGRLKGFLLNHEARFTDGTVFSGAMTALLYPDGSALVVNDAGVLARIASAGEAVRLGTVPNVNGSSAPHFLRGAEAPRLQVGDLLFQVSTRGDRASFSKVSTGKVPDGFALSVVSADGKSLFADNGKDRVVRLEPSGKTLATYRVEANGGVTSTSPGGQNDAWVGMVDGTIFHLLSNGRTEKVAWGGTTCPHAFDADPGSGSISDADVLLEKSGQVYISDPGCRRIVALGIDR